MWPVCNEANNAGQIVQEQVSRAQDSDFLKTQTQTSVINKEKR